MSNRRDICEAWTYYRLISTFEADFFKIIIIVGFGLFNPSMLFCFKSGHCVYNPLASQLTDGVKRMIPH